MSMNRVILEGRIGTEVKLEEVGSHTKVNILLACDRSKGNGCDWIPVVIWDKQAMNVAKYQGKGSRVAVEGRIRAERYDRKDGTKGKAFEVVAERVTFLESRDNREGREGREGRDRGKEKAA